MRAPDPENSLMAAVSPGRVVSGKYRIGGVLGVGPSSVVVEVEHTQTRQPYAMKVIDPEVVRRSGGASRLVEEIRVASQLTSPHVVRVTAVGALDSGEPYVVMELVRGHTLSRVLRERGPMRVETAADYALEACFALVEAHRRGIVHGALSPGNLFIAEGSRGNPIVKVSDLGMGLRVHDSLSSGEQDASTYIHASPEQLVGNPTDMRTDVWAVGVVLFELVSGRPPFTARKLFDVLERGHTVAPPLLRSVHGEVPPGFDAIIRRCLSLHPDHRYGRITELAADLSQFCSPEAKQRFDSEQEPETQVSPNNDGNDDAPDSATRVHFEREPETRVQPPPPPPSSASAQATLVSDARAMYPNGYPNAQPNGAHGPHGVPAPPSPLGTLPSRGALGTVIPSTLQSPGGPVPRPLTSPMQMMQGGPQATSAMQGAPVQGALPHVTGTAKLSPQIGAMMQAMMAPGAAGPSPNQVMMPPNAPPSQRTHGGPPSSTRGWDELPTMIGPGAQESLGPPPQPVGAPPLMVAEVIPETGKRTAIIAIVALALLLIVPLVYLNSLAKKTTVAPRNALPSATTAMPAYSFQQGQQQPSAQPSAPASSATAPRR